MRSWKIALIISAAFIITNLSACEQAERDSEAKKTEKPYKVAILLVSDMYLPLSAEGLKQGMLELGYREGTDVEYIIYNAEGDTAKLPLLARKIVDSSPDVICPSIIPAINAVRKTATDLPVVFLESMYPVEFGVVKSLTRPGTNYTGVSNMTGPMSGKRLELLKEMVPDIKRVAVICNLDNRVSKLSLGETKKAAFRLGLELEVYLVYKHEEVDEAIARVASGTADALVLNPDFMIFSRLDKIAAMALKKKIPTMGIDQTQVKTGILASYGGGLKEIARQAARHVDKILKGHSPAEIPVEPPRRYKLYVNMKTAEAIGVKLPEEILHQAAGYYR